MAYNFIPWMKFSQDKNSNTFCDHGFCVAFSCSSGECLLGFWLVVEDWIDRLKYGNKASFLVVFITVKIVQWDTKTNMVTTIVVLTRRCFESGHGSLFKNYPRRCCKWTVIIIHVFVLIIICIWWCNAKWWSSWMMKLLDIYFNL